jgi:RHS repeat-associated protein
MKISGKQSGTTRMTTTKQYDYLNRLTQISSAPSASYTAPLTYNYNYNSANQRTKDTLADGSYWMYSYDSLGQVTNGCKYFANGVLVPGQQFDYTFDTIGNRTQTKAGGDTNGANLRVANYSANNLNQLTNRDIPAYVDVMGASLLTNAVTVNGQTAYRNQEYYRQQIPANNSSSALWTNITVSGGAAVTGNVYVAEEPETFMYDADGNLTNDGRWAYTWDGENRLVAMTNNTSAGSLYGIKFSYDPKGRRIQKVVVTNGVTLYTDNFLYDGWNLVSTLNSSLSLLNSFVWGNDLSGSQQRAGGIGGLLEVSYYGTSTTNCFPAYDGNGNVMALVNAADSTLAANYDYGPFGELIRVTGAMGKINPLRFSTKYNDDESDLLYYGYRYYKPSTGAWPNRDPKNELGFILLKNDWISSRRNTSIHKYCASCRNLSDTNMDLNNNDANLFAYVENSPIELTDELGLEVDPPVVLQTLWEVTKSGTEYIGDEASLLEIFTGCGGLDLVLAYAETQNKNCMLDALGGPPSQDASAECKCQQQWSKKITVMIDIHAKECSK